MKICMKGYSEAVEPDVFTSVAEPEPHLLVGAGAVMQCRSGSDGSSSNGSGSDNGIKHG
jgi:hypothetical protein